MLLYSGDSEPLENIRMLVYCGDSEYTEDTQRRIRERISHFFTLNADRRRSSGQAARGGIVNEGCKVQEIGKRTRLSISKNEL